MKREVMNPARAADLMRLFSQLHRVAVAARHVAARNPGSLSPAEMRAQIGLRAELELLDVLQSNLVTALSASLAQKDLEAIAREVATDEPTQPGATS